MNKKWRNLKFLIEKQKKNDSDISQSIIIIKINHYNPKFYSNNNLDR